MKHWLATLALACAAQAQAQPGFAEVKAAFRPSDLQLLDRRGEPLQTLRMDKQQRRLAWVPLAEVSPALLRAVLLSEDRRFYEHSGVDWSAVASSAWANLWNQRTRGASTVTMQLAGLLDEDEKLRRARRSTGQKLGQAVMAKRLETSWTKAQILEAYLNLVPLRGELVGVHAAARQLFERGPSGLDAREAALMAALLRAPNAGAAPVAKRACALLQEQDKRADCTGIELQAAAAFSRRSLTLPGAQLAPHFARLALRADGPIQQRSTLDARTQGLALELLQRQLNELQGRNVSDGAVVVLDNASGEVRAWVGSSGAELSSANEVDGVLARRQPGSALKPFVYELAIERRLLTAASLLDDSPAQISTANGLYLPQNYDRSYRGWVSVRTALGNSLNVPAVRVAEMLSPDLLATRLQALGMPLRNSGSYYGTALALGGAEVSLLDLANAYRVLANDGIYSGVVRPGATAAAERRVLDAGAAFIVTDILADASARALTFGFGSVLSTGRFAAVKTGTSKDMRDNWCLGFNERFTVGVWVGNSGGEPMHAVSGTSGAAPVWAGLMRELGGASRQERQAPPGVLHQQVSFTAPLAEPPRDEWFLDGTQLARVSLAQARPAGIANPRDGAIYALDPDIPPAAQKIVFEGKAGQWRLDGRPLGRGERLPWAPQPGRHRLALVDAQGGLVEEVGFEVRGASLKPPAKR
ncbi:penicillin-binding protein 1C [Pelomonas sp. KK5]|uniref:penicillin-binding protein 1C n=1 Tax=Pelomonas sp. KK5 TaxID=1855730 RepID=UPI00097C6A22|nr:penicillin-binding protein 1C [Pelomonas sp. KK5]